jgi:hypothetical protein
MLNDIYRIIFNSILDIYSITIIHRRFSVLRFRGFKIELNILIY